MKDYIIITDSCVDIPDSLAKELELVILPLKVTAEGKEYQNFLDEREIKSKDFYQLLRNHIKTSTAQATPQEFIDVMAPVLNSGKDILSISFSSALSGTYNSSLIAKKELLETFPDAKIECVDSLCASMGQGLLLTMAARKRLGKASLQETKEFVESHKMKVSHLFTVDDLGHLRRGGRLSAGKELLGNLLNVKPLLHVSNEGRLVVYGKGRGRINSLHSLVNQMEKTYKGDENSLIYVSHGDALDDAIFLKELILSRLPVKESQFMISPIGPVIGSHSGAGTIALFYIGNDRL